MSLSYTFHLFHVLLFIVHLCNIILLFSVFFAPFQYFDFHLFWEWLHSSVKLPRQLRTKGSVQQLVIGSSSVVFRQLLPPPSLSNFCLLHSSSLCPIIQSQGRSTQRWAMMFWLLSFTNAFSGHSSGSIKLMFSSLLHNIVIFLTRPVYGWKV